MTIRGNKWLPMTCTLLALLVASDCMHETEEPSDVSVSRGFEGRAYAVGVHEPVTLPAGEIQVPDQELVMGVTVGEKHRAYRIAAFAMPKGHRVTSGVNDENMRILGRHIVNDVVGGLPISVTHCDRNGRCRVFHEHVAESIDLLVGGFADGEMQLLLDGRLFSQDAADAPVEDYPFQITTWGRWRATHPDTDIYAGVRL